MVVIIGDGCCSGALVFWAYNKLYYDKLFPAPVMEGQGWRRVFGSC
jgi:hypothetical protein